MPNPTDIVLTDDSSVSVTFKPRTQRDGVVTYTTTGAAKPVLEQTFEASSRVQSNGASRIIFKGKFPVIEADSNGVDQVIDNVLAEINIRIPDNASSALRADVPAYLGSLVADPTFTALVEDLEGLF